MWQLREEGAHVFGPSPAEIALANGTTDNWSEYRSTNHCHGITNDGSSALFGCPDITQNTASIRHWSRAEEAREEPSDHNSLQVFRSSRTKREDSREEVRRQHSRLAPKHFR